MGERHHAGIAGVGVRSAYTRGKFFFLLITRFLLTAFAVQTRRVTGARTGRNGATGRKRGHGNRGRG